MEEALQLEAALTKGDLARLFLGRPLWRRRGLVWFSILVSIGIVGLRATRMPHSMPILSWVIVLLYNFAAIFILMTVSTAIQVAWSVARLRPGGVMLEPKRITIDDAGIACVGATSSHLTNWKLVRRLRYLRVGLEFVLREPVGASLLIPRRALDDAAITAIEAFFARSRA